MTRRAFGPTIAVILALAASAFASAEEPAGSETMTRHYEAIRQALLNDGIADVAVRAESIRQAARLLEPESAARDAAVPESRAADSLEILAEIQGAATRLGSESTIEGARKAFGELSRAMVRHRQLLVDPERVVVHCAMAEAVWIQPKGEIGNPYFGQSMARCGEIVSE